MMSLKARGVLSACAATAALAAVAMPSTASAAEQCSGGAIHGKGSSAQKILQIEIWNKDFNTSGNAMACNGSQGSGGKPAVTYTSTGSGAGLESWGVEQQSPGTQELWFAAKNAFIGTEIAPNAAQEGEIESHTEGAKVLTIPVAQPAIAIVVHLPKGCKAKTTSGVLQIKQKTLEEIFSGKITTFSKLGKFTEATKKACKAAHITRVVREDGSGTTDSFKKALNELAKNKPVYEDGETFAQNGEKTTNTSWPDEGTDPVLRGNGGGGLVSKVASTEGSIGFANVADARANKAFIPTSEGGTGGPGTEVFWAEVENSKKHFANPSTNGETAKLGNSNCESTEYVNGDGKKKFPPPSALELWNEVTVSTTQTHYFPCYLTYDLALTKYAGADKGAVAGSGETESAAPTAEEAQTAKDYIKYELSTGAEGGQEAAEGQDYLGDPKNSVLTIAREGAEDIGF